MYVELIKLYRIWESYSDGHEEVRLSNYMALPTKYKNLD
jgi:hypothetical protein